VSDLGLDIASSGIAAQQALLDTTAQDLANVSTPGYARETVNLQPLAPASANGVGQGVLVGSVTSTTSSLYEQLNMIAQANLGAANEAQTVTSSAQTAFPEPGSNGLQSQLSQLWTDMSALATSPANAASADTVIRDASNVAGMMNQMSSSMTATATQLQNDLTGSGSGQGGLIGQVNSLLTQVAQLNAGIVAGGGGGLDVNTLMDQRRNDLNQLASMIGIRTATSQTGAVTVYSGGISLVQDATATALQPTGSASGANLGVETSAGVALAPGGQIGALLQGVNTTLPGYQSQLDGVADKLATTLNALQASGTSAGGTSGSANPTLFVNQGSSTTYTAGAGSAATIAVSGALLANPSLISTAAGSVTGASIDPTTIQAMAALGSQTGGPDDLYQQLVGVVGSQAQTAQNAATNAQALSSSTTASLSSVEGVDTNEETVNMLSAQRAFQATAQVINSMNTSFQALLQAV